MYIYVKCQINPISLTTQKMIEFPTGRINQIFKKILTFKKNNVVEYLESRRLKPPFNFICVR